MSPQKPDISIIIPAYNEEKFIGACLSSVFKQHTTCHYEVIVADNGSKDATSNIAGRWDIKLISETKPGPAAARNAGAAAARADILYFVDADCRLPQGLLQNIFEEFQNNPASEVVSGPCIYDQDGLVPLFITKALNYFAFYHMLVKVLYGIDQFPGGNFAIRKESFVNIGGLNESINNREIVLPDDLELAVRLHAQGTDVLFDRKFATYSSFRRVKKSPLKHSLIRFRAALSLLRNGTITS